MKQKILVFVAMGVLFANVLTLTKENKSYASSLLLLRVESLASMENLNYRQGYQLRSVLCDDGENYHAICQMTGYTSDRCNISEITDCPEFDSPSYEFPPSLDSDITDYCPGTTLCHEWFVAGFYAECRRCGYIKEHEESD